MTTKNESGKFDCKIEDFFDDEPYFIVRAKDPSAAHTVREWVSDRERRWKLINPGENMPDEYSQKLEEALRCADAMELWWLNSETKRNNKTGHVFD